MANTKELAKKLWPYALLFVIGFPLFVAVGEYTARGGLEIQNLKISQDGQVSFVASKTVPGVREAAFWIDDGNSKFCFHAILLRTVIDAPITFTCPQAAGLTNSAFDYVWADPSLISYRKAVILAEPT